MLSPLGAALHRFPAQRCPSLDLDAADERRGVHDTGVRLGDGVVLVDAVARHRGADAEARRGVVGKLVQVRDLLDVDYPVHRPAAAAHLDEDVCASRQGTRRVALLRKGRDRFLDGCWSYIFNGAQ